MGRREDDDGEDEGVSGGGMKTRESNESNPNANRD